MTSFIRSLNSHMIQSWKYTSLPSGGSCVNHVSFIMNSVMPYGRDVVPLLVSHKEQLSRPIFLYIPSLIVQEQFFSRTVLKLIPRLEK